MKNNGRGCIRSRRIDAAAPKWGRTLLVFASLLVATTPPRDAHADPEPSAVTIPGVVTPSPAATVVRDSHAGRPIVREGAPSPAGDAHPARRPSGDFDTGRVALALAAVLTLIFLLRSASKKLFPAVATGRRSQAVKVLTRCPLAPRQQVLLLQVGRRIVVVGESGAQLTALSQITDADEVAALIGEVRREKSPAATTAFSSWFGKAREVFARGRRPSPDGDGVSESGEELQEGPDADESRSLRETGAVRETVDALSAGPRSSNTDFAAAGDEVCVSATRAEIRGLTDRVRDIARQLGRE